MQTPVYVLEQNVEELKRLGEQGLLLAQSTEALFRDAGICEGMRVLDLGAGAGDVAFLLSRMVGAHGSVVSLDRSGESLAFARERAIADGVTNVRFVEGEISEFHWRDPFDAVVGRLILMYLPDPAAILKRLSMFVKPGGIFAFYEMDFTNPPVSFPPCPLMEVFVRCLVETFRRSGAEIQMGLKLRRVFEEAGLKFSQITVDAKIYNGEEEFLFEWLEKTLRSVYSKMKAFGIDPPDDVRPDGFADRLRLEVLRTGSVVRTPFLYAGWARKS